MTLPEFKAWFEGFTEDMADRPTAKQWKRIQERVAEITGQAVSYPVYVERYARPLQPYWPGVYPYALNAVGSAGALQGYSQNAAGCASQNVSMADVGRADALALKAA